MPEEDLSASGQIHTMPEKFLTPAKEKTIPEGTTPPPKGKKTWLIFVVLAVFLLLVFASAGFFVYRYQKSVSPVSNSNLNQNLNQNANVNAGLPVNLNKNTNTNVNTNTNRNVNLNTNKNVNANANINENTNTPPTVTEAKDTDKDDLAEKEEILFGTKANKPDSDGDGYLDGEEIINLYSPNGPEKLAETNLVAKYESEKFGFTLLYPTSWKAEPLTETETEVFFTSEETGEYVEIIVQDNPNSLSAQSWYLEQFPKLKEEEIEEISVGELSGVKSETGYNVYFADDEHIYTITYNYGTLDTVNFVTTWEMIWHSFSLSTEK